MSNDHSWADNIVDELLPTEFDWRSKVRAYPKTAMVVAAGVGFFLARARGSLLTGSVANFATDQVTHNITSALNRRRDDIS